jgi:short-subunit dehydrogenase
MVHSWRDETVVVTGASRGIGLELCRRLTEAGARVGMIANDAAALTTAAEQLDGAIAARADVADAAQVSRALAAIEAALGSPTVLVNNAGHGHWGAVVDTDPDDFRRAMEVNYLGVVHTTGAVLRGMLQRRRGHIVNVASVAGRMAAPFEAAYSASKFAVVGYSEALRTEVSGTGVHVSVVDPGPVDTEFFARRGRPLTARSPKPVPAGAVADAIIAAVERRRVETFVPRWLGIAYVAKTMLPAAYRAGTARMYAPERDELLNRRF